MFKYFKKNEVLKLNIPKIVYNIIMSEDLSEELNEGA